MSKISKFGSLKKKANIASNPKEAMKNAVKKKMFSVVASLFVNPYFWIVVGIIVGVLSFILIVSMMVLMLGGSKTENCDDLEFVFSRSTGTNAEQNAKSITSALRRLNYTDEMIAGALGNLDSESHLDSTAVEGVYEDNFAMTKKKEEVSKMSVADFISTYYPQGGTQGGAGVGLIQWSDLLSSDGTGAKSRLFNRANAEKANWWDINFQIKVLSEVNKWSGAGTTFPPSTKTQWQNKADVETCTKNFFGLVENSESVWGNSLVHAETRVKRAKVWYQYIKSNSWTTDFTDIADNEADNEIQQDTEFVGSCGYGEYLNLGDGYWDTTQAGGKRAGKMMNEPPPPFQHGQLELPDWDRKSYFPQMEGGLYGQCTWYVYNRLHQIGTPIHTFSLGFSLGNGGDWYNNARSRSDYVTDRIPHVGWAICFPPNVGGAGNIGHIAVVEAVDSQTGNVLISESNNMDMMSQAPSGNANYRVIDKTVAEQCGYIQGKPKPAKPETEDDWDLQSKLFSELPMDSGVVSTKGSKLFALTYSAKQAGVKNTLGKKTVIPINAYNEMMINDYSWTNENYGKVLNLKIEKPLTNPKDISGSYLQNRFNLFPVVVLKLGNNHYVSVKNSNEQRTEVFDPNKLVSNISKNSTTKYSNIQEIIFGTTK